MELEKELICRDLGRYILELFEKTELIFPEIAQTNALNALGEIKDVINNKTLDEFMMMHRIVGVFERYGIDAGGCGDF